MNRPTVVHVIDDDSAVLHSLSLLLRLEGYAVRAHESVQTFLDLISEDEVSCIVADVRMPGLGGIDLLQIMKERRLFAPMVLITAHADVPLAIKAIKMGAVDLLEKPFGESALIDAVEQALTLKREGQSRDADSQSTQAKLVTLTSREKEVLAGVLKGKRNKVIAGELGASTRTVEVHRARLMAKLEVKSLSELLQMVLMLPHDI
jgi:two-component system response regulator FixJ